MSEIARIARLLTQSVEGKPYHGPSLLGALDGITAEVALERLPWSAHSVWELALHVKAELQYARAVIEGTAGPWIAGETTWSTPPEASDEAWASVLRELRRESRALVRTVAKLDDAILSQKPIRVQGPYYRMLHGTLHHIVFHTGQRSLLAGQRRAAAAASQDAGDDA
jgi:hypothetical protein